jgi:hypothetical protein
LGLVITGAPVYLIWQRRTAGSKALSVPQG